MTFSELGLIEPLCRALASEGYSTPTPIQTRAIPAVLEGRDLLGCAQTGTGKTAAFSLPLLQRLGAAGTGAGHVRALVLSPTRELAAQIGERIDAYGAHLGERCLVIYGGVSQKNQEAALRRKPSIIVATPGRLLDLIQQRFVDLSRVEVLVLDEADRMLDMGFIHDVRRIVGLTPKTRQTLFFSATMPQEIAALGKSILKDPVRVEVTPSAKTADKVQQGVYFVPKARKRELLEKLLGDPAVERALVFSRTKHGANRIAGQLERAGIAAAAIHGNKTQGARERALSGFKGGSLRVLVATDIAARGIDVDGVTHVVNFDLPADTDSYVHRIGRTGRAGASGVALSFCDAEERSLLADIEKLIRAKIPTLEHALGAEAPRVNAPPLSDREDRRPGGGRPNGGPRGDDDRRRGPGPAQARGGGDRSSGGGRGAPSGGHRGPRESGFPGRPRHGSRPDVQTAGSGGGNPWAAPAAPVGSSAEGAVRPSSPGGGSGASRRGRTFRPGRRR